MSPSVVNKMTEGVHNLKRKRVVKSLIGLRV